jgi:hypothetical protein
MRLGLLVTAAAFGLGMLPATASATYRLCINVVNPEFRAFNIQVGAGSYAAIGQERCRDFTTFGPIRARMGSDPIIECEGDDVPPNNTAQIQLEVSYGYYVENKANPYQAKSCRRTQ